MHRLAKPESERGRQARFGAIHHQPAEQQQCQQRGGEYGEAYGTPAEAIQHFAGTEGGHNHKRRNAEVIGGLHLAAFGRRIGCGQHGGAADEAEIPAKAQKNEGDGKIPELDVENANHAGGKQQNHADGNDPFNAPGLDQVTGEKAGHEHGQHMPLNNP